MFKFPTSLLLITWPHCCRQFYYFDFLNQSGIQFPCPVSVMVREKAVLPGIVATALNSTSGYCENSTFVMAYRMSLRAPTTSICARFLFTGLLRGMLGLTLAILAGLGRACPSGRHPRRALLPLSRARQPALPTKTHREAYEGGRREPGPGASDVRAVRSGGSSGHCGRTSPARRESHIYHRRVQGCWGRRGLCAHVHGAPCRGLPASEPHRAWGSGNTALVCLSLEDGKLRHSSVYLNLKSSE